MGNEFFVSRVPASTSGPENIHFLANLKRTLSIAEAKRLRDTLTSLLGEPSVIPQPSSLPSAEDLDAVATEVRVKESTSGKVRQIKGK